eukprot:3289645-Rhodomonas_salina.1
MERWREGERREGENGGGKSKREKVGGRERRMGGRGGERREWRGRAACSFEPAALDSGSASEWES